MDPTRQSDPFLLSYNSNELKIASDFLSNWLPFLTRGLCRRCTETLSNRVRSLQPESKDDFDVLGRGVDISVLTLKKSDVTKFDGKGDNSDVNSVGSWKENKMNNNVDTNSLGSWKDELDDTHVPVAEATTSGTICSSPWSESTSEKMSWADMAQEDELEEEGECEVSSQMVKGNGSSEKGSEVKVDKLKIELSREQREQLRFHQVKRKKDFICFQRVDGKLVNILDGLELHTGVFSAAEQKRIVKFVEELQDKGKNRLLKGRTYTAPQKWMKGKGRVTLQFGCCYNYATDRNGNPPGILKNETVDPLPQLFKTMIKRLVRWHVLPPTCVPDSCIVNIYDEGDCIPPHIDNHEFVRPFCTVSFLSECDILFGTNLKVVDAGVFSGPASIPLPMGSVLVLSGNGADVAKHCVPSVPTKRISITFRRMDELKRPVGFVPEPDLQGLQPLSYDADRPKKSTYSESRHVTKKQANNREENGNKGKWSTERSVEPRDSVQTRRGPASRRSLW